MCFSFIESCQNPSNSGTDPGGREKPGFCSSPKFFEKIKIEKRGSIPNITTKIP
jgi:hypothetical protein